MILNMIKALSALSLLNFHGTFVTKYGIHKYAKLYTKGIIIHGPFCSIFDHSLLLLNSFLTKHDCMTHNKNLSLSCIDTSLWHSSCHTPLNWK